MLGIPINESTVGGAVLLAVAFLAVGFVTGVVWIAACEISRRLKGRRHDVGPDQLRLLEELDAHPDDYVATDPELAAGFARLRAAIRNEQQKGEQA